MLVGNQFVTRRNQTEEKPNNFNPSIFITMTIRLVCCVLLFTGATLIRGTVRQQVLPVSMMAMPNQGYVYGVNGYGTPYATGYGQAVGQTVQRQQTVSQVTQTRPGYGTVMNPISTGAVVGQPLQHVQTTRVNQVRTVPVQVTGMSG